MTCHCHNGELRATSSAITRDVHHARNGQNEIIAVWIQNWCTECGRQWSEEMIRKPEELPAPMFECSHCEDGEKLSNMRQGHVFRDMETDKAGAQYMCPECGLRKTVKSEKTLSEYKAEMGICRSCIPRMNTSYGPFYGSRVKTNCKSECAPGGGFVQWVEYECLDCNRTWEEQSL